MSEKENKFKLDFSTFINQDGSFDLVIENKQFIYRITMELEELENINKELDDFVVKVHNFLEVQKICSCENCKNNTIPLNYRCFVTYFPKCSANDTVECKFKKTFRSWIRE